MEVQDSTIIQRIEALLRAEPANQECVVRRRDSDSGPAAVACIVLREQQLLRQHLDKLLENDGVELPCSYVSVGSIPLTPAGETDDSALDSLTVIDEPLGVELAERLQACAEVEQSAVVIDDFITPELPLHLSDVLPDWMPEGDDTGVPSGRGPDAVESPDGAVKKGVPAVSYGGDLLRAENSPVVLNDALQRAAAAFSHHGLVYVQDDGSEIAQSYVELHRDAQAIARGLAANGTMPGDRVLFQLHRSQDFIPAFWGCVLGGFVPVPVAVSHQYTPDDGAVQKLVKAWQMLHKPVMLTDERTHPALEALAGEPGFDGLSTLSMDDVRNRGEGWNSDSAHRVDAADTAVILLTSGSTGAPKGVVLSHANLIAMALGTAQQNGFTGEEVTLNWMPLEHVGAVSFLQTMAVILGCRQVHAPTDYILQNPLFWLDLIDRHRATITWGPNFAFGLLKDRADAIRKRSWDLSSMRFMVTAAEQIAARTVREILKLLAPHDLASDSIHPAFGMSETCSGITWSNRFSLESTSDHIRYVDLGAPIPSATLRIVDADNAVLEEGEIGRLQLKGPSVTSGYFENPERNQEVFAGDGWFDTGDLGYLHDGRLVLTGREKEEIIINGINYTGAEIEAEVEAVAGVQSACTAAIAVHEPGAESDRLAVFFVASVPDRDALTGLLTNIRQKLAEGVGVSPSFLLPLDEADIPKTDIGKIQRKLLRQRFESGAYRDVIRWVDILSQNANTIPDWFMQRRWIRKQGYGVPAQKQAGTTLLFVDDASRTIVPAEALGHVSERFVSIEPGGGLQREEQDRYRIDVADPERYTELLRALSESSPPVTRVLHFWSCGQPEQQGVTPTRSRAMRQGLLGIQALLQALDRYRAASREVELFVFSTGSHIVDSDDEADIAKAALDGFLQTAQREFTWLTCRHVDLGRDGTANSADAVLQEIGIDSSDRKVAWRDGQRRVERLARARLPRESAGPVPFVTGGLYVISGGLGALGAIVARYLLESFDARLLLLGRREALDNTRRYRLQELQQAGGAARYRAVNICDTEAVEAVVEQAETDFERTLDGVLHLAGSFHQASLREETGASLTEAMTAKVDGGMSLHTVLERRGGGVFISFNSVNGYFGGTDFAAYSAASSFLTGLCRWQNRHTPVSAWCLEWSMWDDMGISEGFAARDASRAQGYYALTEPQAMNAFRIGLSHDTRELLIGLDAANWNIRRHLTDLSADAEWLQAYVTLRSDTPLHEIRNRVRLADHFGHPADYRLTRLEEMPLTETGMPDKVRLYHLHGQRSTGKEGFVAPRSDFEHRIAAIWKDVLGIGDISIHHNFFGLGGDSLKGALVMNRLQEETGITMHVVALFNAPTIAELAAHLGEDYTQQESPAEVPAARITAEDEARFRSMVKPLPSIGGTASSRSRAVFVLSPPRSGSTLLRVMLGGHPRLFAPPELYLLSFNYLTEWRETFTGEQTFWREGLLRALMEIKDVDATGADRLLQEYVEQGVTCRAFFDQMQVWLGDRLLVDKTPTYALDIEVLRRIERDFDNSHFIHLQRHPYGVIRSFDEARLDQLMYAFMPSLRGGGEPLFSRQQLAELIWLVCNRNIQEFISTVPRERCHVLRFEDLVTEPETSMQQVCRFLELDYDESMLQPYDKRHAHMTDGVHAQSRMLGDLKFHRHRGIDPSVADSWKKEYKKDFLGDVTLELARTFGYDSIDAGGTLAASSRDMAGDEEDLLSRINEMSDEEIERELEKMMAGGSRD